MIAFYEDPGRVGPLLGLLEVAERNARAAEAFMDGEYDPGMVYEELERRRNKAVNKPRRNARSDAGFPAKK
jgi:hypothetical protein